MLKKLPALVLHNPEIARTMTASPCSVRPETVAPGLASTVLRLNETHGRALRQRVRDGFPLEVCGLLIGRLDGDDVVVDRLRDARNLNEERAHDRFELAPEDFLAADREARDAGLDVVGIWHSHPSHPAIPSVTDLEAAWEGYSYLIIRVDQEGATDFRSWRLQGDRFQEEKVSL